MAGRERSGPEAARGDLFAGRPWVVTPGEFTEPAHLDAVMDLIRRVGAEPIAMSAQSHDAAVAVVSHAPQAVASAMAAQLTQLPASALDLAGPGIRDVTRIAASDPELWVDILDANASPVAAVLDSVIDRLEELRDALREVGRGTDHPTGRDMAESAQSYVEASTNRLTDESLVAPIRSLLADGNVGRARLPGKHGTAAVRYAVVPVVIPDEPGALARLLLAAGAAGVNVEDVGIEHAPGQPVGLVELSVHPDLAEVLGAALADAGWRVH